METVAAVAEEHADVIRALPKNGIAVFPADSEFSGVWKVAAAGRKVIDFALTSTQPNSSAAVSGYQLSNGCVQINLDSHSIEVQLNTLGAHNVRNALAASAVALAAGISLEKIKQGLEAFAPVNGRMQIKFSDSKYTLIDDSYNANPDSVRAAIDALKQSGDIAWLVLGDMGEVGNQGPEFHREVGAYAAEQGIAMLFFLGEQSIFAINGFDSIKTGAASSASHFTSVENLISKLNEELRSYLANGNQHLNILVKGSRFMRMERVVQALLEEAKKCS
jgi:UDP-N-acetylmuramoyl-tripeptide--D-alanyl-D-alanine ligase